MPTQPPGMPEFGAAPGGRFAVRGSKEQMMVRGRREEGVGLWLQSLALRPAVALPSAAARSE
eukprot:365041-Chlamydomonas_euryale.AAC.1